MSKFAIFIALLSFDTSTLNLNVALASSWRSDLLAVAEPGEKASEFLQNVMNSMRVRSTGKARVPLPRISNLADLVGGFPRFCMNGTLYRFMGRHTQVGLPDSLYPAVVIGAPVEAQGRNTINGLKIGDSVTY